MITRFVCLLLPKQGSGNESSRFVEFVEGLKNFLRKCERAPVSGLAAISARFDSGFAFHRQISDLPP